MTSTSCNGKKKTGGGKYHGVTDPLYFFAANPSLLGAIERVKAPFARNILIAVNEIRGNDTRWKLLLGNGYNLFLDSGIFNLSMEHARKHGVHMNEALSLAPQDIDGFDDLFNRYVAVVSENEESLWGYVELDQGGRDNKIITRTRLENEYGLSPIPVFHPLNDGWDYLDFLFENYDRICLGNIVKASPPLRIRLLAEVNRRWKNHPDVWIHGLGLSPHATANTFRPTSCDSSSWIGAQRWGRFPSLNFETADVSLVENLQPPMGLNADDYYSMTASLLTNYIAYDHARSAALVETKEHSL